MSWSKKSGEELFVAQRAEIFSDYLCDFREIKVLTTHAFLHTSLKACLVKFYELVFSDYGTCSYRLD